MGNKTEITRSRIMTIAMFVVTFAILGQITALVSISNTNIPFKDQVMSYIDVVFSLIGLLVAEVYIFSGFSKQAAKYFKTFIFSFLMSELISFLVSFFLNKNNGTNIIPSVINTVVFALLFILLFIKNLGKTVSLSISYLTLIANVGFFVYVCLSNPVADSLFKIFGSVTLSIVLVVTQHMKYIDKEERYAKKAN